MHMKSADIGLACGVAVIWGVNFVVMKWGVQAMPPILLTAGRFLFAALPLVFFVKRPALPWQSVLAYGMFQFALQFSLLLSGIKLGLPAGLASLVMQLQAFFTIGLAVLALGERPTAAQLAGAAIALSGMVLVAANLHQWPTLAGFLLAVTGAGSWAIANILTKRMGPVNTMALVGWGSLFAVPPLLLVSLLLEGPAAWAAAAAAFDWRLLANLAYQGFLSTVVGFGAWAWLMRKYPTSTIAPFSLLVPVTGMLAATLLLGESLDWWKIAAALLVLAGLLVNQLGIGRPGRRGEKCPLEQI